MECPNCHGVAHEHVDDNGGGSVYCLDGCGYTEEIPAATHPRKRSERKAPAPKKVPPVKRK